jgi:hypothetical protein
MRHLQKEKPSSWHIWLFYCIPYDYDVCFECADKLILVIGKKKSEDENLVDICNGAFVNKGVEFAVESTFKVVVNYAVEKVLGEALPGVGTVMLQYIKAPDFSSTRRRIRSHKFSDWRIF